MNTRFLIAAIVVTAIVAVFIGHYAFGDGDAIQYFYPYAVTHASGGEALWNAGLLFGFPPAASFQYGYFSPLFTPVFRLLGAFNGYAAVTAFFVSLAALCTYWFARGAGLSRRAAFLSAVCYSLGQFSTHWVANLSVIGSMAVLPALLLGIQGAFNRKYQYALVGAVITGLALLGAHQQFIAIALVISAAYFANRLYRAHAQVAMRRCIMPAVVVASMVITGFLFALPQLVYTITFTSFSTRFAGLSYESSSVYAATPLDWLKALVPHLSLRYGTSIEFFPFVGVAALLLGTLAIWKLWRSNDEVRFFVWTAGTMLVLSLKYSPLYWLMIRMPVLAFFRGPSRWSVVLSFCLAMLAGFGYQRLLSSSEDGAVLRRWSRTVASLWCTAIALGTFTYLVFSRQILALAERWFDARYYAQTTGLPLAYYHAVLSGILNSTLANFNVTASATLITTLCILAAYAIWRIPRRYTLNAILIITSLEVLLVGAISEPFIPRTFLTDTPAIAARIMRDRQSNSPFRSFAFLIGTASSEQITAIHSDSRTDGSRFVIDGLTPNTTLLWGIQSADGYEPMAPARNERLLGYLGSEVDQFYPSLANESIPLASKSALFVSRLPLLSMANVKYITSAYLLPVSKDLQMVASVSSTRFDIPIYLYENKTVLPRAYLAPSVRFITDDEDAAFKILADSGNDFSKTTLIGCPSCTLQGRTSPKDALTIDGYDDGLLTAHVALTYGRWFVFSESNLPGWRVTIDGVTAPAQTANYLFQAIYVPGGEHHIEFKYVGIPLFSKLIPW